MSIAEIIAKYAPGALSHKLQEAGFVVYEDSPDGQRLKVEWTEPELDKLLDVITTYVMSDWQFNCVERRLHVMHPYLTDDETEYVALLAFHAMRKEDSGFVNLSPTEWRASIADAILQMVERGDSINIDSIMRFRSKEYLKAVDEVVNEVVDHFLVDREYEEFVAMLRYMLDAQQKSPQVLHVFCTEDRVWISDEKGELIRDPDVSQVAHQVSEGGDVHPEDLAMSILITRAPCEIVIHDMTNAAPWPSFAETVERVFLQRASRCGECTTCQQLKRARELRLFEPELNRPAYPGHE
jgi:putative sporulation protein YtxC